MATVNGSQILARTLRRLEVDTMFYLMGGPMLAAESACIQEGIRSIDVRHEQAAAMMGHAYARVLNKLGVCMACSGPGAMNLVTGVANAWADGAPLLAIAGASPVKQYAKGAFQEMDQLAVFEPITKWSQRVYDPLRIPEIVALAVRQALNGPPGPVYLDLPGDVLYREVDEDSVRYPHAAQVLTRHRPAGEPAQIDAAVGLLEGAERPIIVSGSGVLWSGAAEQLRRWVDATGIPFYTTPQGRGVVPDDHELSFLTARSSAFREADLVVVIGTRINYTVGYLSPPRFAEDAKLIQVDVDPAEIGHNRPADVGIVGDAAAVLEQLLAAADGRLTRGRYSTWTDHLKAIDAEKTRHSEAGLRSDATPIHPLRLCKEVRDFLDRDAILVVDGQEILNYGRQSIPTYVPGHRMNSGPFGTMGVGLPFGLGAKAAMPDKQVLVLHGDGSLGLNAMELDTAVRWNLPVVTVVSLNGGWTADPAGNKPGRDLGYTRYDKMAEALGCHGEYVEQPSEIRPALQRAFESGKPAVVNVKTDHRARAITSAFTNYMT